MVACLGGGGAFGFGVHFGVARALQEFGVPLTGAPVLGTSAGAWTGAALSLGVNLDRVMAPWAREPERRFGHRSVDTVRAVFTDAPAPGLFGVAARLSGRRVLLSAERLGVIDVVAASASPPPLAVPHAIERRRYIDAGLLSICSVDLAPAADLLVVVAPIAGPHMGAMGRFGDRQTRRNIRQWRREHGGEVLYLRPNRSSPLLPATAFRACSILSALSPLERPRKLWPPAVWRHSSGAARRPLRWCGNACGHRAPDRIWRRIRGPRSR